MGELLFIAHVILVIVASRDVLEKLRGDVERFLWIASIVLLPFFGAGFWYFIQYSVMDKRRIERKKRGGKR